MSFAAFGSAVIRHESGSPERCPNCGSYKLDMGYNQELPRPYVSECGKNADGKVPRCASPPVVVAVLRA